MDSSLSAVQSLLLFLSFFQIFGPLQYVLYYTFFLLPFALLSSQTLLSPLGNRSHFFFGSFLVWTAAPLPTVVMLPKSSKDIKRHQKGNLWESQLQITCLQVPGLCWEIFHFSQCSLHIFKQWQLCSTGTCSLTVLNFFCCILFWLLQSFWKMSSSCSWILTSFSGIFSAASYVIALICVFHINLFIWCAQARSHIFSVEYFECPWTSTTILVISICHFKGRFDRRCLVSTLCTTETNLLRQRQLWKFGVHFPQN